MRFSVITVCLNAGNKLKTTLDSVLGQSCRDFEVIIKDGGSSDGSVEAWREEHTFAEPGQVKVFAEKDKGIYDAMNQAAAHAAGDFLVFMNCGDRFADEKVLERVEKEIREQEKQGADLKKLVLYGDTISGKNAVTIASAPKISGFTCYRNIPCHQACFYSRQLCQEKPYDLQYKIRADYDHFLWCFYRAGAGFVHLEFPTASYEGGGYSESRENRKRDAAEHRQITAAYMGRGELLKYRAVMALSLAPLRRAMAGSKVFSGVYHRIKERLYRGRS